MRRGRLRPSLFCLAESGLTIWTDKQGRTHVDPGRLLRRSEALAGSRAAWRALCLLAGCVWLLTLGAAAWTIMRAEARHRAAAVRLATWLGEEQARTRCLEALLNHAPPTQAEIVTVARRSAWVARCVRRELEERS